MIDRTLSPALKLSCAALAFWAASGPIHAQALLLTPPHLVAIDTSGSETAGFALPAQPLIVPVTQLRLRFDQALDLLAGGSLANFRVVEAGADGQLSTAACGPLPAGDDIAVPLLGTAWNTAGNEVALRVGAPAGLPLGHYRVIACDALAGIGGLALDGDGDGLPGGVALRDLRVRETSHVVNPGFDLATDGWQVTAREGVAFEAQRVAEDADGAAASGSLRLRHATAAVGGSLGLTSALCVSLPFRDTSYRLRMRYRVLEGNVRVNVFTWFGFTGDAGESGCIGPGVDVSHDAFTATPSDTFRTFDTGWRELLPAPLGTMSLLLVSADGEPFEILIDDIGFSLDSQVIFRDDFQGH